mgnify:CR=1 FL=1
MKRRVLLAGVGLSSIGVGAAFGSGAFTTVSADRDVELNVESDNNARISFKPGNTRIVRTTDGDSDAASVVEFSRNDLNEQSKTLFEGALDITNNGDEDDPDVDVYVEDNGDNLGDGKSLDFREHDADSIVGSDSSVMLEADASEPNNTVSVDVVVDLREDGNNETTLEDIDQVTFVVEAINAN